MMKVAICIVLVLAMAGFMIQPGQAVDCVAVDRCLVSCTPFLVGTDAIPSPACCTGVATLKGMAVTTPDKRQACSCVKQAAARYPNIKDDTVKTLPTKCNSPLPFPISKDFNCDTIP